ncbi:hypothetical protein [Daejeonella sp.]|uniref:hypothetical protein n=1 Tax=Daejeonella sp. TaxID=2805397 RepID=UPI0030BD5BF7
MKSNVSQRFLSSNEPTRRVRSTRYFRIIFTLFLIALSYREARAQNYIVNYLGLNLDARDLVYYPAGKLFMINSINDGQLGYVNSDGQYRFLLKDSILIGTAAMKIQGNTLYAIINPVRKPNAIKGGSKPQLVKLNLSTNKIESVYELGDLFKGLHYVTDLTVDPDGVVYIADALAPVIYKVDKKGRGSVLVENELLSGITDQIKSIAYHKHEYLLVSVGRNILKVDLKTKAIYMVSIEKDFDDINSIHFTKEYLLVVSEGNADGRVHILNTSNSWLSGQVLRTDIWKYKRPVNIEFVDNRIYVLDSEADKIAQPDFSIRVIDLNKLPANKKRKARIIAGDVTILKKDF